MISKFDIIIGPPSQWTCTCTTHQFRLGRGRKGLAVYGVAGVGLYLFAHKQSYVAVLILDDSCTVLQVN